MHGCAQHKLRPQGSNTGAVHKVRAAHTANRDAVVALVGGTARPKFQGAVKGREMAVAAQGGGIARPKGRYCAAQSNQRCSNHD